VEIKDGEWCGDMGEDGAACFHTLSPDQRDIPKPEWDKERFGMICTRAENFANWKASILKLCEKKKNRCSFEFKQRVMELSERADNFISTLEGE